MSNNSVFILTCSCFMPAIMIIFGFLMWKHHPKKFNYFFGYRTARSMRSLEAWNFGNEHFGRLWFILGWATLIPTLLIFLPLLHSGNQQMNYLPMIVIVIQAVVLAISFIPTEIQMRKKFKD